MGGFSLRDGMRALGTAAWIAAGTLVGTGIGLALFLRTDGGAFSNSAIETGDRLLSLGIAAVALGAALMLVRVVTPRTPQMVSQVARYAPLGAA